MAAGKTNWYPADAAEHDRELIVELGEEFGAAGPYVIRVLKDLAAQQRADGDVRTGFRVLARKAFCTLEQAREIVQRAGAIHQLDDLVVDEDGRRFTCRISGWAADVDRGRAALKKSAQRARAAGSEEDGDSATDEGDVSPGEGDTSPKSPLKQNETKQEEGADAPHREPARDANADRPDVHGLCALLAELMLANDPKAKVAPESKGWLDAARLLIDRDGRTAAEIAYVIRWCQADDFERANVLSMPKLRQRFPQLWQKAQRGGGDGNTGQPAGPGDGPRPGSPSAVHPADAQAALLRQRAAAARAAAATVDGTARNAA